jgi:TRAP-type C4-dicarboxylate transport system substrate-binding protein
LSRSGALLVLSLAIASCGGAAEDRPEDGVARREPGLTFRLANELLPDGKIWEVSRLFKDELEHASPDGEIAAGEIEVVFFDQGMVGTERQLLENAYFGVMEIVQINTSVVTTIDPAFNLFDLPYAFVSDAHHRAVLHGEVGAAFLERLRDRKLVGLGLYGLGFRNMFYRMPRSGCIRTPEDLRGLKMRVIESPIMIAGINALGASATPVPFSELFQAIRTGVVDGADNSARVFTSSRFYETGANCFTLTEHFTNQHILVANRDWFDSLEPKYQRRILEVARGIVPEFDSIWEAAVAEAVGEMAGLGVTVNEVDDKDAFIARVTAVPDLLFAAYPEVPRTLYDRMGAAAPAEAP